MIADYLTFVRELPTSFSEIGAMLPSSPALAKQMVKPICGREAPITILEVGPGTGPFTKLIIENMRPQDRFVICEINSRFMARLKRNLAKMPAYRANADRIVYYEGAVQDLPSSEFAHDYDIIVSSLPFLNFTPGDVEDIFKLFQDLLAPGGSLTFFHYMALSKIQSLLPNRETRERVRGVEKVIDGWCDSVAECGVVRKRFSYLNIPPAMSIEFAYPA